MGASLALNAGWSACSLAASERSPVIAGDSRLRLWCPRCSPSSPATRLFSVWRAPALATKAHERMVAPGPAALAFNALQLPAPMPLVQGAAGLRMLGVAFASDRVLFNLWYHTRRLAIGNTNILLLHVTHGDDAVGGPSTCHGVPARVTALTLLSLLELPAAAASIVSPANRIVFFASCRRGTGTRAGKGAS